MGSGTWQWQPTSMQACQRQWGGGGWGGGTRNRRKHICPESRSILPPYPWIIITPRSLCYKLAGQGITMTSTIHSIFPCPCHTQAAGARFLGAASQPVGALEQEVMAGNRLYLQVRF
jgi:hypothetical protein